MPFNTQTDKNPLRFDTVKNVCLSLLRILKATQDNTDCFNQLYLAPDGHTYLARELAEKKRLKSYRNLALASILNNINNFLRNFGDDLIGDDLKGKLEEKKVDLYFPDPVLKEVIKQIKQIDYACPISFEEPIIPVQCVISGPVIGGLSPEQTYSLESIINWVRMLNDQGSDKRYGLYIFNRAVFEIFYLKHQLNSYLYFYPFSDVHEYIQKISKAKNLIIQSKYLVPVSGIFKDIEKVNQTFEEIELLRGGLDFSFSDFSTLLAELDLKPEEPIGDYTERLLLERATKEIRTEIEEVLNAWLSLTQCENAHVTLSRLANFFQPVKFVRDSFIDCLQTMRPFNFIRSVR